jgi:hypothetical protein
MEKRKKPHSWYNRHLYYVVNLGFKQRKVKDYKALVRERKSLWVGHSSLYLLDK